MLSIIILLLMFTNMTFWQTLPYYISVTLVWEVTSLLLLFLLEDLVIVLEDPFEIITKTFIVVICLFGLLVVQSVPYVFCFLLVRTMGNSLLGDYEE